MVNDLINTQFSPHKKLKFVYVASPYSHDAEEMRQYRYEVVLAWLSGVNMRQSALGEFNSLYYSPIVHHHEMAKLYTMPTDAEFWWWSNRAAMDKADKMVILRIPGYTQSKGVQQEIAYAQHVGLPYNAVDPYDTLDPSWRVMPDGSSF